VQAIVIKLLAQATNWNRTMSDNKELILVTGASGFIAGHCIIELIKRGYRVRGTVRSVSREAEVRAWLDAALGRASAADLQFIAADLSSDGGWSAAMTDVKYVLHVASPIPPTVPKDPEEIIGPARDGTLRVLRAAHAAGVKRVVQTSSTAAITYGIDNPNDKVFTEKDWNDPAHPDNVPYTRSKAIAERAAWDELDKLGSKMEWVAVCPALVIGPVLDKDSSPSVAAVGKLLGGEMPGVPRFGYPMVDVRDLADLHIRAMTSDDAAGQRYLGAGDFLWLEDIAKVLRDRMGDRARKVPKRNLPNFVVKMASWFDPIVRGQLFELGKVRRASSDKAKSQLGWTMRPLEQSIVDTAESLLRFGVVKL
jgi:dihydroflavonol-4-reductase